MKFHINLNFLYLFPIDLLQSRDSGLGVSVYAAILEGKNHPEMIGNGSWLAIKTCQRMLKNNVIMKRCCQTIENALGQPTNNKNTLTNYICQALHTSYSRA